MSTVKTVGLVFTNPDAIRIPLMVSSQKTGYYLHIYTGKDPLVLEAGAKNVVIVPRPENVDGLASQADDIHRLIILARGKPEFLESHDIPILDATLNDSGYWSRVTRPVLYYRDMIDTQAKPLTLPLAEPKVQKKVRRRSFNTLVEYLDYLEKDECPIGVDFQAAIVRPTCQVFMRQISMKEFAAALKAASQQDFSAVALKRYLGWVQKQAGLASALKRFLDFAKKPVTVAQAAEHYKVDTEDVEMLCSVYTELQGGK